MGCGCLGGVLGLLGTKSYFEHKKSIICHSWILINFIVLNWSVIFFKIF